MAVEKQTIQLNILAASVASMHHRVIFNCILKGLLGRRNGMVIGKYPVGSLLVSGFDLDCDAYKLGIEISDVESLVRRGVSEHHLAHAHPTADWSVLEPYLDLTN